MLDNNKNISKRIFEKSSYDSLYFDLALRGRLSSNLVGFCHYLRKKGHNIGMAEQIDAMRAIEKLDLQEEDAFRIALRITLSKSEKEQALFDKYFHSFWYVWESSKNSERSIESEKEALSSNELDERLHKQRCLSINDWMDNKQTINEEKEAAGYSSLETKSERDFNSFKAEELSEIIQLINEIGKKMAYRLNYRTVSSKKKVYIDFRRTVRNSLRRGGEILEIVHLQKRHKRLKLVLLCDVSKSMDLYSRFLIQFIYAFQFIYRRIETFVFSTSLHRITETLRNEELYNSLENLAKSVPEWSGGTKIGHSLEQFVKNFGIKLIDSQTVCLIISDGWDTGEVVSLERSMWYLKKHSRSIIWLNPLKGSPEYEPTTRGMQVALPYIDIFSSAHNLNSLRNLASQLAKFQS